ncbi:mCG146893 [Mus musculus]|jgi:hypothetical protein|nr:mCG146893 [Mus musculus]
MTTGYSTPTFLPGLLLRLLLFSFSDCSLTSLNTFWCQQEEEPSVEQAPLSGLTSCLQSNASSFTKAATLTANFFVCFPTGGRLCVSSVFFFMERFAVSGTKLYTQYSVRDFWALRRAVLSSPNTWPLNFAEISIPLCVCVRVRTHTHLCVHAYVLRQGLK